MINDNVSGLLISVIPGLAHRLKHRFKEIRWYFLAWLILILSGLFLYGSPFGYICLGLAVGVHAAIALQYGILKYLPKISEKAAMVVLVLLGLTFLYRFIPQMPFVNITGAHSSLTIPYYNVETGDYLVARGGLNEKDLLARGSLILIRPVTLTGQRRFATRGIDATTGEIEWLQKTGFSVTIPKNSYFVSIRYNVRAHGVQLVSSDIKRVCLVNHSDIEAKAFMRWWPLSKRGFIN
ncbi:MAG: hypothetical protein ACYSUX_13295 [Planctomycetota bacterium]